MYSLLVVCVGNICRSPMAAALLAKELPAVEVSSAGIGALIGSAADPSAIELMARQGIDIGGHRAQQLSTPMCRSADLILVMDQQQKQAVEERFISVRGKVFLLVPGGVFDPYRKSMTEFESCLTLIEQGVNSWLPKIRLVS